MAMRTLPVGADGAVIQGPCLYYGGLLKSTAGGIATTDVFDGNNTAFPLIDSFTCAASSRDRNALPNPIFILRGLFVDVGANVSDFTLYYDDDIPEDSGTSHEGP